MSVLAKGDLALKYGVPWQEMDWHKTSSELVDWPGKIAANLKLIGETSEPENLMSVELVMMIHTHPSANSLKAI